MKRIIYFYENVNDGVLPSSVGGGGGGGSKSAEGGPYPLGHRNGGMMEWWNGGKLPKILNTERRKITPNP